MPENIYQQRKAGNALITMARNIFSEEKFRKAFHVLSISRINDADGKDVSIKVEMHVPGNPKAMDIKHISVLGYTAENQSMWQYMLRQEAETSMKKMRMVKSRAGEVKELSEVNGPA